MSALENNLYLMMWNIFSCRRLTPGDVRRIHLQLLPAIAAQLQRCLKSQPKHAGGAVPQQLQSASTIAATAERVLSAQRRLPRAHPLAGPLAGACSAVLSAAKGVCTAAAVGALERMAALLPADDTPLWPQVRRLQRLLSVQTSMSASTLCGAVRLRGSQMFQPTSAGPANSMILSHNRQTLCSQFNSMVMCQIRPHLPQKPRS